MLMQKYGCRVDWAGMRDERLRKREGEWVRGKGEGGNGEQQLGTKSWFRCRSEVDINTGEDECDV
jgi:hypothetical protein